MRSTLSWEICDICQRRVATTTCRLNGRLVAVCPFCRALLEGRGLVCGEGVQRVPLRRRTVEPNEELIRSVGEHRTYRKGAKVQGGNR
ncbi:MAG: hypothetical protein L7H09_03350 [Acidilobus sp.]|nr:hypothetical protein [Acidilobus sp.]MCG2874305.1 hypothetical protein [Acidilobus sp.]MCI4460049.1 hypothetical protein [Acidilobus sp.]NAZ31902.1 hypothetical protein [Acidilobus sp.]